MKKLRYYFSSLVLSLCSCQELITTQSEEPMFSIESLDGFELDADGESFVILELKFQRLLSKDQPVTITTSNGVLLEFPVSNFAGASNSLTVSPNSESFKFVLKSSKDSDSTVLLSAKLNNLVAYKNFIFKTVCPNELLFDPSDIELSISGSERCTLNVSLLLNNGPVSDEIRVDFTSSNDSIVSFEPRIFFTESNSTITAVPRGKLGTVDLTATINQDGCSSISEVVTISVVD